MDGPPALLFALLLALVVGAIVVISWQPRWEQLKWPAWRLPDWRRQWWRQETGPPLRKVVRARLRRRPQLPPVVDLAEIPTTTWAGLLVAGLVAFITYRTFPYEQALGYSLLTIAITFGPRSYKLDRITAAVYDLVEGDPPILNIEKWEARRKNWWRSRLKSLGLAIDYTYSDLSRAAARKGKWVKLELRPRWSLWPRENHVTAVRVRVPPRQQVSKVLPVLAACLAAEFFNCDVELLKIEVTRQLRKNWIRFAPELAPPDTDGKDRPTYADRVDSLRERRAS